MSPTVPRRLGVHVSTAGGLPTAVERAEALGCTAFQLFTANARRWTFEDLCPEVGILFRQRCRAAGIDTVVAHAAYLLNLASPSRELHRKSLAALEAECRRCHQLGIELVVFHPGSCPPEERREGLRRIAAALATVLSNSPPDLTLCVELTAGQGATVGGSLEELAFILEQSPCPERLGICIDTCHALAAGYRLDTEEGYAAFWHRFETLFGSQMLRLLHLNDSAFPLGSRRDRHAHIGLGHCGLSCFWYLLHDPRWEHVPHILETPKGRDDRADRLNLWVIRQLAAGITLQPQALQQLWHEHGTV